MNKKIFGRKLSRSRPAREALFASLMRSLILNGKIKTTRAKAKAVQSQVERLVTLAKKGNLAGKRKVLANFDNARDAMDVMYQRIVPSFTSKSSGFTRLILLPNRRGDNAEMVSIEWTEKIVEAPKKEKKVSKKSRKVEKKTQKKVIKKEIKGKK